MRGRTTSALIVCFTLLSSFLLLGSLTSASSALSRTDTTTTTSGTSSVATGLHELTFIQENLLSSNFLPWSITLSNGAVGNLTEVNPSNTTILPWWTYTRYADPSCTICGPPVSSNQSLSTMTFLVPFGSYHYEEYTAYGMVFGQVDFSPSNPLPVGINPIPAYDSAP